jgi:hypothetical protein
VCLEHKNHTYLLLPYARDTMIVAQLVKKFPAFVSHEGKKVKLSLCYLLN